MAQREIKKIQLAEERAARAEAVTASERARADSLATELANYKAEAVALREELAHVRPQVAALKALKEAFAAL